MTRLVVFKILDGHLTLSWRVLNNAYLYYMMDQPAGLWCWRRYQQIILFLLSVMIYRLHPPHQSFPAAPLEWGSGPASSSLSPAPWCWCSHPLHLVRRCQRQPWTLQHRCSTQKHGEPHFSLQNIRHILELISKVIYIWKKYILIHM